MHTPLPSGAKPATATAAIGLALLALYLIWGSTYLAIAVAIETMPPFLMAGLRFLLAGGALYAVLRLRGASTPSLLHWRSAAIVGGLLLLGGNGLVSWAESRVPSGLAALLIAAVPLWMVLLEATRRGGSRPGRAVLGGLLLGFLGIILLLGPGDLGGAPLDLLGAGALLVAALSWATGSVHGRRFPQASSVLLATAMQMLAGGALLMLAGTAAGEWARFDPGAVSTDSLLALAYLVSAGSILGLSCYVWLLRVAPPALVGTYAFVNPVVAVALGWAFLAEPLTLDTLTAAAVICAGVAVITLARSEPQVARARRAVARGRALAHRVAPRRRPRPRP